MSNLQLCLLDLKKRGFQAVSFELSPHELGVPERRSRIFIIASLELTLTELQEVVAIVKRWVVEEDESRIPLRSFLFKEGAPELDQWFDKLLETKAERAARTMESEKKKKVKDDDA